MMQFHHLRVTDALDFAAENHGEVEIVSRLGDGVIVRHTYAQLHGRARQAAGALVKAGFGFGDKIATLAWNHHAHFELYYAVPGIGGILHTINPRVPADQIAYMIDVSEDKALAFDSDFAPLVAQVLARVSRPLVLIELGAPALPSALSYEEMLAGSAAGFDWVSGKETDPCGLCFTSGTTGAPKGVLYTHRSTILHAMACCMSEGQAISSRETILPVVPMFHANAWGLPHAAPMSGARLVLPGRHLDAVSLLRLVADEGVTFLAGVPTIWQGILDQADVSGEGLGALKRAGIGGAAPSEVMIRRLESFGVEVFHAWGMTETNPLGGTGFLKPKHSAEGQEKQVARKLSQGRPVFGLRRRIIDDDGKRVTQDGSSVGRLVVRGNWVVARYLNAEASLHEGEWFDTGDIASIDADGYMRIVDRAKDLIKSGGEWISSIELENIANGIEGVMLAAALGRPDPKWGERPIVVIKPGAGAQLCADEILSVFGSRLAKWQVPDQVIFVDDIPLSATGKVDKKVLRSRIFA